jgi:hypothetical protein
VNLPLPGGVLDGRGGVVGGEVVPVPEAGHVADLANDVAAMTGPTGPAAPAGKQKPPLVRAKEDFARTDGGTTR